MTHSPPAAPAAPACHTLGIVPDLVARPEVLAGPRPRISVVVPAHDEALNLPELIVRLRAAVAPLGSYEIVNVDDGSRDDSWRLLEAEAARSDDLVAVRLQRCFGQHPAVTAGFSLARGEIVVTIDADLQNPPEEIPALVARLGPNCDVASGWRQRRKDSWVRRLPSKAVNATLRRATGVYLHDYGCMLRAYKRAVVDQLLQCPELTRATTGLVSWLGVRIVEVPVRHEPRRAGASRYRFWRLLRMNFDILTGFSTGLLQTVSLTGIIVSLIGFSAAIVLVVWRITHGSGPVGLTTFLAALMFLAGMQVAAIGIVGEYVGRIFTQVQGRPYFIVAEVAGAAEGKAAGADAEADTAGAGVAGADAAEADSAESDGAEADAAGAAPARRPAAAGPRDDG